MKWSENSPYMNPNVQNQKKYSQFQGRNGNQIIADVYKSLNEVLASDYIKNLYMTMAIIEFGL